MIKPPKRNTPLTFINDLFSSDGGFGKGSGCGALISLYVVFLIIKGEQNGQDI